MKANYYHIIDQCIDEGVKHALNQTSLADNVVDLLADSISKEIWVQLDYYFTFDDN